jgi:hypothetical protein
MSCCEEVPNQTDDIMAIYYEIERALDWAIAAQSTVTEYDEPEIDDLDKALTAISYAVDKLQTCQGMLRECMNRRMNFTGPPPSIFETEGNEESEEAKKLDIIKALVEDSGQEYVDLKQRMEMIRALTTKRMPYGEYPDPRSWSIEGK